MITKCYSDKKAFVKKLSDAYQIDGSVKKIEYEYDPDTPYPEVVTITFSGGWQSLINVHMCSHTSIAKEIATQIIGRENAIGYMGSAYEGEVKNIHFGVKR